MIRQKTQLFALVDFQIVIVYLKLGFEIKIMKNLRDCSGIRKWVECYPTIDFMGRFFACYCRDNETWDTKCIAKEVGIPLCEGILAFENGEYQKAVETLYPIRYEVIKIGGSHAQVPRKHTILLCLIETTVVFLMVFKIAELICHCSSNMTEGRI